MRATLIIHRPQLFPLIIHATTAFSMRNNVSVGRCVRSSKQLIEIAKLIDVPVQGDFEPAGWRICPLAVDGRTFVMAAMVAAFDDSGNQPL